ncbi:MAG: GNAT family N-acetyltransferase [Nocardioidaceae bacterium]
MAPEADRDGRDGGAVHVVALERGRVVATCRLLLDGELARLGRMAVERERRGRGLGTRVLAEGERAARSAGATRVRLHAQTRARGLYERAGYGDEGERFIEEGIEHVAMEKRLA